MRRWGLALALLLSVGVNLGILATLAVRRTPPPQEPGPVPVQEPQRPHPERPGPDAAPPPEAEPQPGGPPLEGREPPRAARLADRLGLEGEPRRRFLEIQTRFYTETVRLRTEQAEVFRALRRELTAETPDRARIEELTQASGRTHMGLQQAMARNVLATREVLDPAQERLFLDVISRLAPPGAGGEPPGRRPPPWQPRRPRWR